MCSCSTADAVEQNTHISAAFYRKQTVTGFPFKCCSVFAYIGFDSSHYQSVSPKHVSVYLSAHGQTNRIFPLNFLSRLCASLWSPREWFGIGTWSRCNHNACCVHASNRPAHPLSRRPQTLLYYAPVFTSLCYGNAHTFPSLKGSWLLLLCFSTAFNVRKNAVWCTKPVSTLCWVHTCCFSLGLFTATQIRIESNSNGCRDCLGLGRGPSCEVFHAVCVLFGYLWSTNASWKKKSEHFLVDCKLLEAIGF